MTPTETVAYTRYVRALFPHQKIDEYTADAWHDAIRGLTFQDATAAAVEIVKRQPFISPSEIIAEARRGRGAHPSDRTVREAITQSRKRAIGAPSGPPTSEYLAAKQALVAKHPIAGDPGAGQEERAAQQARDSRSSRGTGQKLEESA